MWPWRDCLCGGGYTRASRVRGKQRCVHSVWTQGRGRADPRLPLSGTSGLFSPRQHVKPLLSDTFCVSIEHSPAIAINIINVNKTFGCGNVSQTKKETQIFSNKLQITSKGTCSGSGS